MGTTSLRSLRTTLPPGAAEQPKVRATRSMSISHLRLTDDGLETDTGDVITKAETEAERAGRTRHKVGVQREKSKASLVFMSLSVQATALTSLLSGHRQLHTLSECWFPGL